MSEETRQLKSQSTDDFDVKLRKMIESNIAIANKHVEIIRQKPDEEARAYMKTIFETYDVVWGVWNDPKEGFGMFPLKGNAVFRWAINSGQPVTLKTSAIHCTVDEGKAAQRRAESDR